ncbi:MAG: flavin reductase, partial [Clostridia bacterium]
MIEFNNMECLNSALNTGAFLISGDNVMVASWGFVGVMWGKKVFIAPVRESRFTKEFIDKTGVFTVSVPKLGEMKQAIAFCGSKSGRNFDKWKETGLQKQTAKSVDTVVVAGCERYFECKVLTALPIDVCDNLAINKWYPTCDNH